MTSDEFRKMALEIPTAVERSHMNHPDFRVAGKIFASLAVPDKNWGMVKLTPEQQREFIKKAPRSPQALTIRNRVELRWIHLLRTPIPLGLNLEY